MSELAVSLKAVSKAYNVYPTKSRRFLDFLGLGVSRAPHHQHFWALQDVTFDVPRGTTIGIIGRNGAGKTTLLRVLSGNTIPTSGELHVNGTVSPLLELGTGFHPELTGRENIYAVACISKKPLSN